MANDFAVEHLQRRFDWDWDFIHCPPDFDTDAIKSVWILCDFNVPERIDRVETVLVQCWHVRYGHEGTP